MTRGSFYNDINRMASESFGEENMQACIQDCPDGPLWKRWELIWWTCAKQRLADLRAEGLEVSANALEGSLRSAPKAKEYFDVSL